MRHRGKYSTPSLHHHHRLTRLLVWTLLTLQLCSCGFVTAPVEMALVAGAGAAAKGTVYGFDKGRAAATTSASYLGRQSVAAAKAIDYRLQQWLAVPESSEAIQVEESAAAGAP